MPIPLADAVACFEVEATGEHNYTAPNMSYYGPDRDVLFAGQLIGQAIAAATASHDGKVVQTISSQFPRGGRVSVPVVIRVRPLNSSRAFATAGVSILQGDRLISESLVLLHAPDEDAVRHGQLDGFAYRVEDAEPRDSSIVGYRTSVAEGVNYMSPDDLGPPNMKVWVKFDDAPQDPVVNQGLVAIASAPFLIGVALRPHPGLNIAQAHETLSTGVVSHTLTFHEDVRASEWNLFVHEAPYAGRGRSFGRGEVFTAGGDLVASFSQDGMLRRFEQEPSAPATSRL